MEEGKNCPFPWNQLTRPRPGEAAAALQRQQAGRDTERLDPSAEETPKKAEKR